MTAIVGLFGQAVGKPDEVTATAALAAMSLRGADRRALWSMHGAALGSAWNAWEEDVHEPGYHPLFVDRDIAVVADATLYFTAELRRKLVGVGAPVLGSSPATLIAAAYRAWGDALVDSIEGDYAFVLYDSNARRAIAVRDPSGTRPLYFGVFRDTLVVATEVRGVEAHPDSPRAIDVVGFAEQVAGLLNASDATHAQGVRLLRGGERLARVGHEPVRVSRFWTPPAIGTATVTFTEAARELRDLLDVATVERVRGSQPASVWLSGGYDSTAVFGTLCGRVRDTGEGAYPHAVSMSYPPGDAGHEDGLISAVAQFWGRPVHWRQSTAVPLVADDPVEAAGRRDGPVGQMFEHWLRSLAAEARAIGSRVILNGHGGDHRFGLSSIYLAELLRRRRLRQLWRDWILRRGRSPRGLLEKLVYPLLPLGVSRAVRRVRGGRPLPGSFDRDVPPWFDQGFVKRHQLLDREYQGVPRGGYKDVSREEVYWSLTDGLHPWVNAMLHWIGLSEGAAVRMPMFDSRLVTFSAARPMEERASGLESKLLLREAMKGLLPKEVLAARSFRTGLTSTYFEQGMRAQIPELRKLVNGSPWIAEFGFIDVPALRKSIDEFESGASGGAGTLHVVLESEFWLRSR